MCWPTNQNTFICVVLKNTYDKLSHCLGEIIIFGWTNKFSVLWALIYIGPKLNIVIKRQFYGPKITQFYYFIQKVKKKKSYRTENMKFLMERNRVLRLEGSLISAP